MQIYRAILTPFLTRNDITGCLSEQSFTTGGRFAQAIPNPIPSSEGKKHRQELSMVLKSSVVPGRWQKRLTRSVVTHTKPSDESQMQCRSCMQGGRVGVGAAEGQRQGSRSQTSWNSGLPKQMGKTEAENEHSP